MSNEITVGDAEPTTETTAEQSNMSVTDFIKPSLRPSRGKLQKRKPIVEATNEVVEEAEVESNAEETNEEVVAEQIRGNRGAIRSIRRCSFTVRSR